MEDLKLLHQIMRLSKEDVEIELSQKNKSGKKKIIKYKKPKRVSISVNFFRYGACQRCGRSCNVGFNLYWTENEYYDLPRKLKEKLVAVPFKIQGKEKYLWMYRNPTNTPRCDWVQYNKEIATCTIHESKPIHCALPPIQIDQKRESTIVTKRLFGRNFKFGCLIEFTEFNYQHFKNWDLPQLQRLWFASQYLEIPSHLEEIISLLSSTDWTEGNLPEENIVIYDK